MVTRPNPTRNLLGWCLVIVCLWVAMGIIGCRLTEPSSPPYPPGVTPTKMMANVPLSVRRSVFVEPPTVTFTCDIGDGRFDGVNLYESAQPGNLALLQQFGPTNVFPVSLNSNWPHFIEIRTFTSWPAPYVVTCVTNDDSSVNCQTNTYYEGVASDYLWVPAGMTNQWMAAMPDGTMELIGWGVAGATYQVKRGALDGNWQNVTNFTGTNGPWTVPDDGQAGLGTNGARFFWTTVSQ